MCVNEDKILRMKDLIKALTEADIAYYRDDDPVMSDREYDQLTDELLKLEAETGLSEPYAPEKSKISEDNPTLAIPLPDGTYLRAVGYPTDTCTSR